MIELYYSACPGIDWKKIVLNKVNYYFRRVANILMIRVIFPVFVITLISLVVSFIWGSVR